MSSYTLLHLPHRSPKSANSYPLDGRVRTNAFAALRSFLTSGAAITQLDLLKLWRGLYFSMWHTPLARSQRLITSISDLTLSLPTDLFLPFSRAFWVTVAEQHPLLDAHRVDKYLYLMRRFLQAQLEYLRRQGWREDLLQEFVDQVSDRKEGCLGVGGEGEVVGDGVRYHLLDIWVEEIDFNMRYKGSRDKQRITVLEELKGPVRGLHKGGRTKIVRQMAADVLADERWEELESEEAGGEEEE